TPPPIATLFPYTTLFRSHRHVGGQQPRLQVSVQAEAQNELLGDAGSHRSRGKQAIALCASARGVCSTAGAAAGIFPHRRGVGSRSEEHTSELQSRGHLVC